MQNGDDDRPNPADWREIEPEQAQAIEEAVANVISMIDRLAITTGDQMLRFAATRWSIEQLEAFQAKDWEAET
jgi:hypothetical protein